MSETVSQNKTLSESQLREILELAVTGPSGDNCQPWEFVWDGKELSVYHNEERGRHAMNSDNQASLLALGCMLEIISLVSGQRGLKAEFEYAPNAGSPNAVWAKVRFQSGDTKNNEDLVAALKLRSTDRREYQRGEFPESFLKAIAHDNELSTSAKIYLCESPSAELIECLAVSESQILKWQRAFCDMLEWVRFTKKESALRRDGMPWMNLIIRFHEGQSLRLIRRLPWVLKLLGPTLYAENHRTTVRKLKSSAGLFCLAVEGTEPRMVIEAGRLAMRTWLRLTAIGFAVQPLTVSSLELQFNRLRKAGKPDSFSVVKNLEPLALNGKSLIDKEFKIPSNRTPVWMFRTGKMSALPDSLRTLRLEPKLKILP